VRAGGQTLTLLGTPRIYRILQSLAQGSKGRLELRRDAGCPAQSTMRAHFATLEGIGAVIKDEGGSSPGSLKYHLTRSGRDLLGVADSVERWLADAPNGPLELGSDPAKAAVKGLVGGWSATVLTTLSVGPMSLTELDKRISTVSYPTIERCLETMRLAEQLEVGSRTPKGTPYALTDWLRRGLVPLALAARWEHRHQPAGVDSISRGDVDDALMLGGPLFKLPGKTDGVCQLAVKIPDGKQQHRTLAYVEVRNGEINFGAVYPQVEPDAWAAGTTDSWFATVIDADASGLKISGDRDLASAVFDGVHRALFTDETPKAGDTVGEKAKV
jgi:DNA-binding HxlR family transcriptional regulator